MMKVYVASRLENAFAAWDLMKRLKEAECTITHDWTNCKRGSHNTIPLLAAHAQSELKGVKEADCLIALLPGGSGTHIEIGAALAMGKPVLLVGKDARLFDPISNRACAFYHHPGVEYIRGHVKDLHMTILNWIAIKEKWVEKVR